MAKNRIIKGQAWISGDKLVQNQTLISTSGATSENTVVLIDNIWEDLMSEGTYKRDKNYFYWEVEQHNLDDELITVRVSCPRPKDGLFTQPYNPAEAKGEWATYWLGVFKKVEDRYEAQATIQPKEIVFAKTEYIDPATGNVKTVEETHEANGNLGDITNLLLMF